MYYSNNFKLDYLIKKGKRLKLWVICQLCIPCQTNWRKWPTGQFSCSSLSLTTGWIMTPHLVRALYKSRFVDTWLGADLSLLNQLKSNWFWHTNNPKYKKARVYRVAVSKNGCMEIKLKSNSNESLMQFYGEGLIIKLLFPFQLLSTIAS